MTWAFSVTNVFPLVFVTTLSLLAFGCSDAEPEQSIDIPSTLSDDEVAAIRKGWPESLNDLLIQAVYSDRSNTYYRLCPDQGFNAESIEPFTLTVADIALPDAAQGDLGCALAGFGHWVVAGSRTGENRQLLSLIQEGQHLLQVEVETSGDRIEAVAAIINPAKRRTLVLRDRPDDAAAIISRWHKTSKTPMSRAASLDFFRALLGEGAFDLAGVGLEDPALLAARIAQEPGYKETGDCLDIPPCAAARRDNALLQAAMYDPQDKADICKRLADWRHDRHDVPAPDETIVRRALVLAIQDDAPEIDVRTASGESIVAEHSKSGYRFIVFSERAPALMTIPRQHFVISGVENVVCKGDEEKQACKADVSVQTYQRALNMPSSVQRDIIESMAREYKKQMALTFERRSARWELIESADTLEDLGNWADATVTKGFTQYFRERAANWR